MHILVVDHRDSFVYNVVEILRRLPQLTFEVLPEEETRDAVERAVEELADDGADA